MVCRARCYCRKQASIDGRAYRVCSLSCDVRHSDYGFGNHRRMIIYVPNIEEPSRSTPYFLCFSTADATAHFPLALSLPSRRRILFLMRLVSPIIANASVHLRAGADRSYAGEFEILQQ